MTTEPVINVAELVYIMLKILEPDFECSFFGWKLVLETYLLIWLFDLHWLETIFF